MFANEIGGMQPGGSAGIPITHDILVDGVPVTFAGYDAPGMVVLMASLADHAIGIVSRNWPLPKTQRSQITVVVLVADMNV